MLTKKKLFRIIFATLILLLAFFCVLYVIGSNSEPYKKAEEFVHTSPAIKQNLGQIKSVRLAFIGYTVNYHGTDGNAKFKMVITGENGKALLFPELKRSLGEWEVIAAKLVQEDGRSMNLLQK
jgi:hypothetical protein